MKNLFTFIRSFQDYCSNFSHSKKTQCAIDDLDCRLDNTPRILCDWEIAELCTGDKPMISPFIPESTKVAFLECPSGTKTPYKILSKGLSSAGYDISASAEDVKIFKHIPGQVVDPKNFNPEFLEDAKIYQDSTGIYFIIPGNSYALLHSVEKFNIPSNIKGRCDGKSTNARCFTGETKVKLVDGDFSFLELIERVKNGEKLYGYGAKNGSIVIQELVSPRFIEKSKTLKVTLDDNSIIECTPDHKFMLRSGKYKRADQLLAGDSLYPIYDCHSHGYPSIWDSVYAETQSSRLKGFKIVHRMVAEYLGNTENHVHHKDENVFNNHPNNLEFLSAQEHARLHNSQDQRHIKGGEKFKLLYENDLAFREHINGGLHSEESRKKNHAAIKAFWESPASDEARELKRLQSTEMWLNAPQERHKAQADFCREMRTRKDITKQSLTEALLSEGTIRGAARKLNVDRSSFRRFPEVIQEFKQGTLCYNHKVKSIEFLDEPKDTYCLTAPDTGNFALSTGVFVKNCAIHMNITPLEPGWSGYLTIEISNGSPSDVKVYLEEGIAQLEFSRINEPKVSYSNRNGKYNNQPKQVMYAKV